MIPLNDYLFLLLNAHADAFPPLVAVAKIIASDVIGVVPVLLAALWAWGDPARRGGLVATAVGAALALAANQIVGQFWYEPRPFMIGLGRTLVQHVPENSFPSDHTTLILAIGIGLIATRAAPAWGRIVILLGVLVGWARIYLGLHFPIDILASALIAGVFAGLAVALVPTIRRWIMPLANGMYEQGLDLMRLPERVFPRRSHRK